MNKREAKRLAEEDTTIYGVFSRDRTGAGLHAVVGYEQAKIVRRVCAKTADLSIILTESEVAKVREGWRP